MVIIFKYLIPFQKVQTITCFQTTNSNKMNPVYSVAVLMAMVGSVMSTCSDPKVTASSYTPADSQVLTAIPFIAEFSLACSNGEKPSLYADIDGTLVPVTQSIEGDKYQVWMEVYFILLFLFQYSHTIFFLSSGILDQGHEGCQDWRSLSESVRQ